MSLWFPTPCATLGSSCHEKYSKSPTHYTFYTLFYETNKKYKYHMGIETEYLEELKDRNKERESRPTQRPTQRCIPASAGGLNPV